MQSAIVRLKGNTAQLTVRAIFDTGSQRTFYNQQSKRETRVEIDTKGKHKSHNIRFL